MALKHKASESAPAPAPDQDPRKRKKVGFAIDAGIEPNACIRIFAVQDAHQLGSPNCLQIQPIDLDHFFPQDGKIYGYTALHIDVWLSMLSFHAYVDVSFQTKSDGGKGVTDLQLPLKSIFGDSLLDKDQFLQSFSRDHDFVRNIMADGQVVPLHSSKKDADANSDDKDSTIEVIRLGMQNANAGLLYSRLVSIVLLLVDGANPIDVTDPKWEIYLAVKRSTENGLTNNKVELLGFATVYHVFYYPDVSRMRIGQHKASESAPAPDQDPRKRKKVGFAIDAGIEPNACIRIFAVQDAHQLGSPNCLQIQPIDLDHFFPQDGKIYGYTALHNDVWLSMLSFHAYVDVSFQTKSDGGKGVTDLQLPLKSIFGDSLLDKDQFLQSFSRDHDFVRNIIADGQVVPLHSSKKDADANSDDKDSTIEVIRLGMQNANAGLLYSRLVSLVLLLVDGANPIDVTDPKWEIYLAVKRSTENGLTNNKVELLGFATVYHFFYYPDASRMRIGQILVLPPFQSQGHGWLLLEAINTVAISENAYDITVEEPSEYLQYLRGCMDTVRLLSFEPVNPAISSVITFLKENNLSKRTTKSNTDPPTSLVDQVRQNLKINKKELVRCWEVLIYMKLAHENQRCMENFRLLILDRVKREILDTESGVKDNVKKVVEVPNDYDHDMTFVMFQFEGEKVRDSGMVKSEGDKAKQEEQLNQLVEEELEEIGNIAKKVSSLISQI